MFSPNVPGKPIPGSHTSICNTARLSMPDI